MPMKNCGQRREKKALTIDAPLFTHLCKINTNMPTKPPILHQSIYNSKFASSNKIDHLNA